MRRVSLFGVALMLVGLVTVPTAAEASAGSLPDTPVGEQAAWLEEASRNLPVSEAEAREHLAPAFLDSLGLDGLNDLLRQTSALTITSLRAQPMREDSQGFGLARGGGRQWHLVLITQPDGLIAVLQLSALPGSWSELDQRLRALAPRVSFLAARLDRAHACDPVHELAATTVRPLGSAFKLYVLGALAEAVRAGTADWDEPLAIRQEWKADQATPFGSLPPGTERTLREYAEAMAFFSDNTATDHLIHRLGRDAVERQQQRFWMRPPRNVPFLTARESFVLKIDDFPRLAQRYLALDRRERRALLDTEVAGRPVPSALWREPRFIDEIEWFGSAVDVCRAFAGLRRQAGTGWGAPAGAALGLQGTVQVGLDESRWPVGWSKGGAEPGVLTRSFLAGTAGGETFVVTMLLSNPQAALGGAATAGELLALAAGAFTLLAAPKAP